ncbi:MAG: leucine-rich repeat domain-containing protein, partial [Firmicutes bacterium]|nr:leucine-rich repeat domain-containing protein [Bacillota bacterium]
MRKSKKLISLVLSVLMVVTMMPLSAIPAFAAKKADQTGNCGANGNNITYRLQDTNSDGIFDKVTLTGSGAMANYDYSGSPWCKTTDSGYINDIIIGSGITTIGDNAFYSLNAKNGITIPNTVTSIGKRAFCNCYSCPSITIPNSVTSIGDEAFSSCRVLTSLTIPSSVTSIGNSAFASCYKITSITIPDSVTNLGNRLFDWCSNLETANLPKSVTSMGTYMFTSCRSLKNVRLPENLTTLPRGTFSSCTSLETVTIPSGVTSINDYAFNGCTALSTVTFERPSDSQNLSIATDVFANCPAQLAYTGSGDLILFDGETPIEEGATLSDYNTKTLTWGVVGEAAIGSTVYTTFAEALAAAQTGDTITLLKDVAVDSTIVVNDGRNITIDTNGNDITSTVRVFEIRHGGVTLTGNGTVSTTAVSAVAVYGSTNSAD